MWPFSHRQGGSEDVSGHGRPVAVSEATAARERAQRELEATRAETPRYQALAEQLRELRAHNNFAPALADVFRGEGQ